MIPTNIIYHKNEKIFTYISFIDIWKKEEEKKEIQISFEQFCKKKEHYVSLQDLYKKNFISQIELINIKKK